MARVAIVLVLLAGAFALRHSAPARGGPERVTDRGGLSFDGTVDAPSRALIEGAIASARPEARVLIDRVDGFTDVRVATPGDGALGTTQPIDGRYDIVLDLGATQRHTGVRGVNRLVLHELGHVVEFQLVPAGLQSRLESAIPPQAGQPVPPEERFAETFAKWAMGNDLGANLSIGYAVPPPSIGFDAWAAPLVALPPPPN